MTHKEWKEMLNGKSLIIEEEVNVGFDEYIEYQDQMVHQSNKNKIHILSMEYNIASGDLRIKRQYFE